MAELRCIGATCAYGKDIAVNALDLHVADGEIAALVGAAGSGKTTALRMIAGIEPVTAGQILIGGADVTTVHPAQRGVAFVFAGFSASERLTIADHIGLPLPSGADVSRFAAAVGLERLHRRVRALSPLERQLLALARAMAVEPRVLLLDEPTTGLDVADRAALLNRVKSTRLTTVYATRDPATAAAIADQVVTLHNGTAQQFGDAGTLRDQPMTVSDARSRDASLNVRSARFDGLQVRYGDLAIPCAEAVIGAIRASGLTSVLIGIAPGDITFVGHGQPVRIIAADDALAYAQVRGVNSPDEPLAIATRDGIGLVGMLARIAIEHVQVFDPSTGIQLGGSDQ